MLIIDDLLISDDIIQEHFACDLNKCKGACCWEGDFGAPLEKEELLTIDSTLNDVKGFLNKESQNVLEEKGGYEFFLEMESFGTTLMPNGACVFLTKNSLDQNVCAFEMAHNAQIISFKKPISCHLYPVRLVKNSKLEDYAINYDRWDICANSCNSDGRAKIKLFRFVKEALIRKFGQEFYDQLEFLSEANIKFENH